MAYPTGIEPAQRYLEFLVLPLHYRHVRWWSQRDFNPQPIGHQPIALTLSYVTVERSAGLEPAWTTLEEWRTTFIPTTRNGGLDGDQTHDLRIASAALYRLSYLPVKSGA